MFASSHPLSFVLVCKLTLIPKLKLPSVTAKFGSRSLTSVLSFTSNTIKFSCANPTISEVVIGFSSWLYDPWISIILVVLNTPWGNSEGINLTSKLSDEFAGITTFTKVLMFAPL